MTLINHSYKALFAILLFIFVSACSDVPDEMSEKLSAADELIEEAYNQSMFAGAVLLVGTADEILHHKAFGYATLYDENLTVVSDIDSMRTDHIFDLASLTKIYATTYGLMALYNDGEVDLDDPLSHYLPEFNKEGFSEIMIRHLLSHTSGLQPWVPTYYAAENAEERRELILSLPPENPPGEERRYSDLGFMLLADLIEEISEMPYSNYLENRIYSRIGLPDTQFTPIGSLLKRTVSTSHGNPFEKKMIYDPDFGYNIEVDPESWDGWRTYTLKGEVNDGNAFYTHSGIAGHAGLFSTAEDLYKLSSVMINEGIYNGIELYTEETIRIFTTPGKFGHGLGWMMTPAALNADSVSGVSMGHTGFTGTNVLVSPSQDLIYILLTNRQHVGVDSTGSYPDLRKLRIELSSTLFE